MLFAGEDEILALVADLIAKAPADLPPMDVITGGFAAVAAIFEDRRDHLRRRREVVRGNDGLRERELRKMAALADVVTEGLRARGVDPLTATLAAELGATVFRTSVQRWLDAPAGDLPATVEETLAALKPLI